MTTDQYTDGTINDWPCNVSIIGDRATGYDLSTAPYTVDEKSPSDQDEAAIYACDGSFKTAKECREFAISKGFVLDRGWGWMKVD